ncbi:MAG: polyamine ABC transporter substrate-binding protein [Proteobacteria bacterium]|nr:MAG: polyamine ABC transporter substrate-binding protein [Pseudomonadota bacterium]
MNNLTLGLAGFAVGVTLAAPVAADEEKILNVYNWSDYIAEDTIEKFEAETGIEVRYDVFDSNEVLEAKLLAGNTGYDVVVPSSSFMARQIQAGVFMPLDKSKLPNWSNLDTDILARLDAQDPGNQYGMPYMWGTTGFAFNIEMIKDRMPDAPTGSWDMLFDPEVVKNFEDCGVTLLDAPTEVFDAALNYLGLDPNGHSKEDLDKTVEMLMKIRPYIKYFHSSQQINDLANGDICLAMGWSGDMFIARDRAAEAEQDVEIEYVIPSEGALIWFDMMTIPNDAPHPGNAHKFLDFLMKPQIAADISNYVWYANANAAATDLVDSEVTGDPAIYPSDDVKAKLFADLTEPPSYTRHVTRAWTKLKTGQ